MEKQIEIIGCKIDFPIKKKCYSSRPKKKLDMNISTV